MIAPRHPRAVAAGELWHGSTLQGLATGFRALGWLVDEVDFNAYYPRAFSVAGKIASRLGASLHRAAYNEALLRQVERTGATVVLTVKGNGITPATLDTLRDRGVLSVNYYPDVEFAEGGIGIDAIARYAAVATTKSFQVDALVDLLGAERVELVQHGFVPAVHRPIGVPQDEAGFEVDIQYIGNPSRYKFEWLLHLAHAFPERSIRVIGNDWRRLSVGTVLEKSTYPYPLTGDLYAAAIGGARINVALHSGVVASSQWSDLVSTRTFEIPACGGFMLHIDNAEVRTLFGVGEEIDSFSSPEQLVERTRHHLDRADERRVMAARGQARAWRDHSIDARAQSIEALIRRVDLPPR